MKTILFLCHGALCKPLIIISFLFHNQLKQQILATKECFKIYGIEANQKESAFFLILYPREYSLFWHKYFIIIWVWCITIQVFGSLKLYPTDPEPTVGYLLKDYLKLEILKVEINEQRFYRPKYKTSYTQV